MQVCDTFKTKNGGCWTANFFFSWSTTSSLKDHHHNDNITICYRAGTPRPLIGEAKSRPFWKLVGGKGEEEERRLAAKGAVSVSPIRFLSLVDFLLFAIVLVFVDIRRIQHFFKCSITRFIICLLVFTEELLLTCFLGSGSKATSILLRSHLDFQSASIT